MEIPLTTKEFLYRVRDINWVCSHAWRQVSEAWDRISPSDFSSMYRQVRPLTMCSNARLRGLHEAVCSVVSRGVPGDIAECGTARGGSAALMGLTLNHLGDTERKIWAFDTFDGLPAPTKEDPDFDIANLYTGSCKGSVEDVSASFDRLGILARCRFVKGLFQNTLAKAPVNQIAVLHIDGDWYESVRTCLEAMYDRVSPGGIVQIDDYGYWKGAKRAVDDFFAQRGIHPALARVDYSGRQLVKP